MLQSDLGTFILGNLTPLQSPGAGVDSEGWLEDNNLIFNEQLNGSFSDCACSYFIRFNQLFGQETITDISKLLVISELLLVLMKEAHIGTSR